MSDEELIMAVRESVARVHATTPAEQIVSRGRAMRTRRRVPGLAGALAIAAGAVLAVTTLVPSGHPVSHRPAAARLAAWTVARQADGSVSVIIREFRDPAGLQRRLRADGVPASVIFYPGKLQHRMPFRDLFHVKHNPCQQFSGGQGQLLKVVPPQHPVPPLAARTTIFIHPSALPGGGGVQFIATSNIGHLQTYGRHALGVWLVQASHQCTGS